MCPDRAGNRNFLPASGAGDSGHVRLTWNERDAANQLDFVSEPVSLTSEEGSCCSGTLSQGRELS